MENVLDNHEDLSPMYSRPFILNKALSEILPNNSILNNSFVFNSMGKISDFQPIIENFTEFTKIYENVRVEELILVEEIQQFYPENKEIFGHFVKYASLLYNNENTLHLIIEKKRLIVDENIKNYDSKGNEEENLKSEENPLKFEEVLSENKEISITNEKIIQNDVLFVTKEENNPILENQQIPFIIEENHIIQNTDLHPETSKNIEDNQLIKENIIEFKENLQVNFESQNQEPLQNKEKFLENDKETDLKKQENYSLEHQIETIEYVNFPDNHEDITKNPEKPIENENETVQRKSDNELIKDEQNISQNSAKSLNNDEFKPINYESSIPDNIKEILEEVMKMIDYSLKVTEVHNANVSSLSDLIIIENENKMIYDPLKINEINKTNVSPISELNITENENNDTVSKNFESNNPIENSDPKDKNNDITADPSCFLSNQLNSQENHEDYAKEIHDSMNSPDPISKIHSEDLQSPSLYSEINSPNQTIPKTSYESESIEDFQTQKSIFFQKLNCIHDDSSIASERKKTGSIVDFTEFDEKKENIRKIPEFEVNNRENTKESEVLENNKKEMSNCLEEKILKEGLLLKKSRNFLTGWQVY